MYNQGGDIIMMMVEGFDEWEKSEAIKLAVYIREKFFEYKKNINKRVISPIKLQKSLYFLFAYWGKFILENKENPDSVEVDYSEYDEFLFHDEIEAWTYGPVVPVVFASEKSGYLDCLKIDNYLEDDIVKKEFIDNLLDQLFEIDDFGLVNISHQDECWRKYYRQEDERHNREIPKKEIIDEYYNKR
jgi:uncharacterized phage-associated protein